MVDYRIQKNVLIVMTSNKKSSKNRFLNSLIFSGILLTNILLVIGTFAIASKITPIAQLYQEKNLCIKYLKHQIDRDKLIKRLKIVKHAHPSNICDSILKS